VSLGACQGVRSGAGGLIDGRDQDWVFGSESVEQDLQLGEDGEITFRTKLRLSFKYDDEE
jgi:hypothetical protein